MEYNKNSTEYKVLVEINNLINDGIYPSVSKIAKWIGKSNSLNSVLIATEKLKVNWFIIKNEDNKIGWLTEKWLSFLKWNNSINLRNILKTFDLPIIWTVACWNPIYAVEDYEWYVSVSEDIIKWNPEKYFILRAEWDSMDKKGINGWDLLLLKNQNYASNWDIVLALIDNDSATLKEYRRNDKWFVQLIPHSTNEKHRPIIVRENLVIQGIFIENLWDFNS